MGAREEIFVPEIRLPRALVRGCKCRSDSRVSSRSEVIAAANMELKNTPLTCAHVNYNWWLKVEKSIHSQGVDNNRIVYDVIWE